MAICIPKEFVDDIKKIVTSEDDSAVRLQKITKLVGSEDVANDVNLLFEKSLLLKQQEKALDKFIQNIDGVSVQKRAELRKKYLENKERKQNIIDNDELLSISKDIYDRKYDIDIAPETVREITVLKRESDALREKMQNTPANSPERMAYGRKVVDMSEIIDNAIDPTRELGFLQTVGFNVKKDIQRIKDQTNLIDKTTEIMKTALEAGTSPIYKAIQASIDASYMFRQGFKTLVTRPTVFAKNVKQSLKPFKNLTSKQQQDLVMREFKASLVSDPLYDIAKDSKLALGVIEEFFPTPLAEKVPVLGNLFKASDLSFTMFSQGTRMGTFEKVYNNLVKSTGTKPTKEVTESLAKVINSMSGRGHLESAEKISGALNKIFFSARYTKSQIDTFTMPFNKSLSPEARKLALQSSVATFSSIGALMLMASQFTEVGTDPSNSRFLKAKIPGSKDRWVDLSAGLGSYIVLATRVKNFLQDEDKPDFGKKTGLDRFLDFGVNKFSPAFSQIAQHLRGQDYDGERPTVPKSITKLFIPITPESMFEAFQNEDEVTALLSTVLEMIGFGQTDYSKF